MSDRLEERAIIGAVQDVFGNVDTDAPLPENLIDQVNALAQGVMMSLPTEALQAFIRILQEEIDRRFKDL